MWNMLRGSWAYFAGAAGTVAFTGGERILQIVAHATAASSLTINGGTSIPIPAGMTWVYTARHCLLIAQANGLVFTSTDSYFVEYLKKAGS